MTARAPEPAATPAVSAHAPDLPLLARVDLPLQEHACATARRTTRLLLGSWDVVDDDVVHDVLVVVSELVGNAVRHGDVRVGLDLQLGADGLVVAVTDGAAALPRQRVDEDDEAESGRGLTIVRALAQEWGIDELPDGKRVWARLPV